MCQTPLMDCKWGSSSSLQYLGDHQRNKMFLICVVICFCIASVVNFFKTRRQRLCITNLPGPITFPLFGSAHKLVLLTPTNFFQRAQLYIEEFGSLTRLWGFHRLFIPTTDYEFVEQLLQHADYQNTGYNLLKMWLGNSLLLNDGAEWEQRRRLITHFANSNIVDEFLEVCISHANALVADLQQKSDPGQCFDIYPKIHSTVLDIMTAITLGIDMNKDRITHADYVGSVEELTTLLTDRFLCLHSVNGTMYSVMAPRIKSRQKRLIKSINAINSRLIDERRRANDIGLMNTQPEKQVNGIFTIDLQLQPEGTHIGVEKRITLLDHLLQSDIDGRPLTNEEISDELNAFLWQGQLLTSSAVAFTLVMIARHPSVQRELLEEMDFICQNETFTLRQLDRLEYLDCVIKETLRLYPAQPIIGRHLRTDFTYTREEDGKSIMPAGAEIYVSLFHMLRDPAKYTDPDRFQPERHQFREHATNEPKNSNITTFSMGARNCIAQKLSTILLKVLVTKILRQYELLPYGDEMRLEIKIVLKSSNGFQLGLKPR